MKFLWRATVLRLTSPIYIVAQNVQSAAAMATGHPLVDPTHLLHINRIDEWDDQANMTVVRWPEPPPPPEIPTELAI